MRRWWCLCFLGWPLLAAASVDGVHRLLVQDRLGEARSQALADLAAVGDRPEARPRRLAALGALLDTAIAARDVAPAEVGAWAADLLADPGFGSGPAAAAPAPLRAQALAVQAMRARRGDAEVRKAALAQALRLAGAHGAEAAYVHQVQAVLLVDESRFAEASAAIAQAREVLTPPRDDWQRLRRAMIEVLYGAYGERAGRDDALAVAEHGVASLRALSGTGSVHYAFGLTYLGQLRFFRGDYLGAARDTGAAVAALAAHPERAMDRGAARMVQANALRTLGDYDGARAAYADAIALAQRDPLEANLSGRLNGLGLLQQLQGDSAAARATFEQALGLIAKPDEDRRAIAVLGNLGQQALEEGDLERAQPYLERSLRLALRLYGADHAAVLGPRQSLGLLALRRGQAQEARSQLAAVVQAQRARYGEDYPPLQQARCVLALASARSGDVAAAWPLALAAERQRLALLQRVVPVLGAAPALAFKRGLRPCDGVLLALLRQDPSGPHVGEAWATVAAARGLATRLQAQRLAAVRARADAAGRAAWQRWESAVQAYADALLFSADAPAVTRTRQTLEAAEAALGDTARAELQALAPAPDFTEPAATAASRLVAFVESSAVGLDDATSGPWPAARRLYAFVRDGSGARLIDLGDAVARSAEVARWERALRAPQGDAAELAAAGRVVRDALWSPLQLDAGAPLTWVPDGAAFRVNPLALPEGDGYLVERGLVVAVRDSERDDGTGTAAAGAARLLLVGAPDFGPAPVRCARGLAPLPGAAAELALVAARWPGAVSTLDGGGVRKEALRRELVRADALHLATHLVALGEDCPPALADARGARLAVAAPADVPAAGNQLALALTDANRYYVRRDPAVLLSVPEILALPLQRLRFVVLAACDSGTGPVQPEEGVFGLRRAFRLAGVGAVVMSLWAVDDRASAAWMEVFYAALGRGQDLPAAVAEASRTQLAQRRRDGASVHPYYWAAYLVAGAAR